MRLKPLGHLSRDAGSQRKRFAPAHSRRLGIEGAAGEGARSPGAHAHRLVAEGVVIVAGVLIALGADRWMQQLDARELEREYLEQLLDDFIQVDSILQRSAADWERRQEQAEVVLAAIDGTLPSTVDARRLALSIGLSHWLFSPPLPRETWQDLIATGQQLVTAAPSSIVNPKTVIHLDLIVKGLGQSVVVIGDSGKLLGELAVDLATLKRDE